MNSRSHVPFSMDNSEFPDYWKSALIFFTLGVVLMTFTAITSVTSLCVQTAFKKSVFTVTGLVQSIAGRWRGKLYFTTSPRGGATTGYAAK